MDVGKIIWLFLITLIGIISGVFLLPISFYSDKAIKDIRCNCKYFGAYFGKIIEIETGGAMENGLIVCWWNIKRKAPSGEIFYDTAKIFKTYTNEEGEFLIPKYSEKRDKYLCCPRVVIFKDKYLNFFDFSNKLNCFKKKEGCLIYIKELSDEQKAEILKILPAEVRDKLKESISEQKN